MTSSPAFSVIIPSYKMGRYIGEALSSVGTQTCKDWEVIAVDDCGPEDGTRTAVEAFAARFGSHRVEYIRHEVNRGVSAARNTAIAAARGEFLAFLDPDDRWGERYFEEHLGVLSADQGLAVSYTYARHVDESGAINGSIWGPSPADLDSWPDSLYRRNFINPSTAIVRSRAIREAGGFDETPALQHVEDWDLWLRLVARGERFVYTPSAEEYHRQHNGAASGNAEKMAVLAKALREKHLKTPDFGRFIAGYVTDLERKCRQLEKEVGKSMRRRLFESVVRFIKGGGRGRQY